MLKLSIAKFKHFNVGHEGGAMSCDLLVDGKLAAHVENGGNGGPDEFRWVGAFADYKGYDRPDEVKAFVDAQPEYEFMGVMHKHSLETLLGVLVDEYQEKKDLTRWCKTLIVIHEKGAAKGKFLTYKCAYTAANVKYVLDKHPGAKVMNETIGQALVA